MQRRIRVFPLITLLFGIATLSPGHASTPKAKRISPEEFSELAANANAGAGDAEAQFKLAGAYLRGEGTGADTAKALEYFNKAAELGHLKAGIALGAMYWQGTGVPKDVERARAYFRAAHEKGAALGTFNLAMTLLQPGEPAESREQAMELLRAASDAGLVAAQLELGDAYFHQNHGLERDFALAYEQYLRAAKQGDSYAQNLVGLFVRDGLGTEANQAEAVEWFRKAAAQGEVKARSNLGQAYLYGQGVGKDAVEAMACFLAATQEPMAQRLREVAAASLTPEQLETAKSRAKELNARSSGIFYPVDAANGTPNFDKGGPR